jgi:predicted anti-sigma-YlaC factor YlaD
MAHVVGVGAWHRGVFWPLGGSRDCRAHCDRVRDGRVRQVLSAGPGGGAATHARAVLPAARHGRDPAGPRRGPVNVRGARWIVSPVVAVLLVVALLPYSAVDGLLQAIAAGVPFVLDPQYARQTLLVAAGVLLVLLAPLARRIATRAWGIVVVLLALVGAVPALFQFARLRPLVVALYDRPLGLGWGLVACMAGFVLLLAAGILAVVCPGRTAPPAT